MEKCRPERTSFGRRQVLVLLPTARHDSHQCQQNCSTAKQVRSEQTTIFMRLLDEKMNVKADAQDACEEKSFPPLHQESSQSGESRADKCDSVLGRSRRQETQQESIGCAQERPPLNCTECPHLGNRWMFWGEHAHPALRLLTNTVQDKCCMKRTAHMHVRSQVRMHEKVTAAEDKSFR